MKRRSGAGTAFVIRDLSSVIRVAYGLVFSISMIATACATAPPRSASSPTPPEAVPAVVIAQSVPGSNALREASSMPAIIADPRIRVGLLTDHASATFPRSETGYFIVPDRGGPYFIGRGMTIRTPKTNAPTMFAVQVAALSDSRSARSLASRVDGEAGVGADVVFDAAAGLYRVLAGSTADRGAADALRSRLIARGYDSGMFVVRRASDVQGGRVLSLTDDEGSAYAFNTDALLVVPAGGEVIDIGGRPYRGGARVILNDRGLLNVINELGLEEYLRGVVPNEMGPKVYDRLEALRAQAIAARTYAVKRRGDFSREGYDLCATPACQVYGGTENEHPLSDQAVRETAGLIMTYKGEPIDALYTSTCGGATSNVSTMFPERNEPYLRGASCVDLELARLEGRADGPSMTDTELRGALFREAAGLAPRSAEWSAREIASGAAAAGRLAGITIPSGFVPGSSRRRDVLGYLGRILGFDDASAALLLPEDREYLYGAGAPAAAAFMAKYRLLPTQFTDPEDLDRAIGRDEFHAILYSWLVARKGLEEVTGKVSSLDARTLGLESETRTTTVALPAGIPLYRQLNDRAREYLSLPLILSDRARVVRDRAGRVFAAVIEANYDGAAFDRTSSYSSWIRSWRADELVEPVSRRTPVTKIEDLRVMETDVAHRVKRLRVVSDGGRTATLEGIVIRWSLNLPDNLFVMSRSVDPDGTPRFTFFGKGWGHGTGMCQVGAYGMAFRGANAAQILRHYYAGVEIEKVATVR